MRVLLVLLVACGGKSYSDSGEATGTSLTPCTGSGSPSLTLGDATSGELEPWTDGSVIGLGTDVFGTPGIRIDVVVAGIDSTEQATAVVDLDVGGVSDTYIGKVPLDCFGDGPADGTTFAGLPEGSSDSSGTDVTLSVTLTDERGVSASQDVSLVIE